MMPIQGLGQMARVALPAIWLFFATLPALTQGEPAPGLAPVDAFHPDPRPDATPLYGGRASVHVSSLPASLCYPIESSAVTRRILGEVHESLLSRDWETFEYQPRLVTAWVAEDMLVLTDSSAAQHGDSVVDVLVRDPRAGGQVAARVIYGQVEVESEVYRVTPSSKDSALARPLDVACGDVARLERGAVMTFTLRDDVVWHPYLPEGGKEIAGHALDADDVLFSWSLFANPEVDCDAKRYAFQEVTRGERVDDRTVRFFFEGQYFDALDTLGQGLTILPAHVYDLHDADNPDYDPRATAAQQAKFLNEHSANRQWVGLGPYRVTEYGAEWIQAERFDDYFDPANGGYLDGIRWRYLDDSAALTALWNGELDYFERLTSADYFGAATQKPSFTERFYKGYHYLGTYDHTSWNLTRPQLAEKAVRRALAHAFDFDAYRKNTYRGLARQVTGPFPYDSPSYDHSVAPLSFDPDLAGELLADAGWYDRDGNGIVDKDGADLVIDFMIPAGNGASEALGLTLQESLARIGVKLRITSYEWATFVERFRKRDFDAANVSRTASFESDAEPMWHSKWGAVGVSGSNSSGVREPELDALIEAAQHELDFGKRQALRRAMHRLLYDLQPFLFGLNVPAKFAMTKRLFGYQNFALDPGYSIRRWYFLDPSEPGTRATRLAK